MGLGGKGGHAHHLDRRPQLNQPRFLKWILPLVLVGVGVAASPPFNDERVQVGNAETRGRPHGLIFLAGAQEGCAYAEGTATVAVDTSDPVPLTVDVDRELLVAGVRCGEATLDNTNQILVHGGAGANWLLVDERIRPFVSAAGARVPIAISLGEGSDTVTVARSGARDSVTIGQEGIVVDDDSTEPDIALDTTTESVEVVAGAGGDHVSGEGSVVTGDPYTGIISAYGQDGEDSLIGGEGPDALAGGEDRDDLNGGPGFDELRGGPGPDDLAGMTENDELHGELGDDDLAGGLGEDTCFQYGGKGPRRSCELPLSRSPLPTSPLNELLVVNQNVLEFHRFYDDQIFTSLKDLESHKELRNFATRLPLWVPYAPDVVGLQESTGPVARLVAAELRRVFGQPYRAVVRSKVPTRAIWTREGVTLHKTSTAIVINRRTTKFLRGGYMATRQLNRDRVDGKLLVNHQAHAALEERASGMRAAFMTLHFNANARFDPRVFGWERRVQWSERVATYMRRNYPDPDMRVLSGEYCSRRCVDVRWETVNCKTSKLWSLLTNDFGYVDAVYESNKTSNADIREQQRSNHGRPHRIDYIFAQADVVSASRDTHYEAYAGDSHYISDHKADYALLTPRSP